jgi:DNA-binding IclR family transcriptional regulator
MIPEAASGIGVLDKSVAVLRAVQAGPLSLAELVAATGLARPTAHRLAVGLETHGLLRRAADGRFALGFGIIELGRSAADGISVAQVARPSLTRLTADVGESSQLYVESAGQRVCVVSVQASAELRTIVAEGAALPLDRGSAGRVLTGRLDADGWVETIEERAAGVASVSAPVRGPGGDVVAAVSISGPVERMGRNPGERFGARILATAEEIERSLTPG